MYMYTYLLPIPTQTNTNMLAPSCIYIYALFIYNHAHIDMLTHTQTHTLAPKYMHLKVEEFIVSHEIDQCKTIFKTEMNNVMSFLKAVNLYRKI